MNEEIKAGDKVKFYDCRKANEDKDYSGKNQKYYPIGEVIKRYHLPSLFGGFHDVVDIKLPDGRISEAHFTEGVIKQTTK